MSDAFLKVASTTDFKKLGSKIAYDLSEGSQKLLVRAVGDSAIAITVKALIVTRSFLVYKGKDISITMAYDTFADVSGKMLTGIVFTVNLL